MKKVVKMKKTVISLILYIFVCGFVAGAYAEEEGGYDPETPNYIDDSEYMNSTDYLEEEPLGDDAEDPGYIDDSEYMEEPEYIDDDQSESDTGKDE